MHYSLKRFFLPAVLLFTAISLQGQVSIGWSGPPAQAGLLELKTQEADAGNVTSDKGGLLLARVKLADLNTLQPFIDTSDADWTDATTREELKRRHTGLLVYNLTNGQGFQQGVYVWDGSKWNLSPSALTPLTATNGLNISGDTIRLGGALTQATTLTLGANNLALTGKLAIGNTSNLSNSALLEINATNKGVLLPRIALTSNIDVATIPNPVAGTVVYNTSTPANGTITPGLVYWEGSVWRKIVTEIPKVANTSVHRLNLASDMITAAGQLDGTGGTFLNFGTISIPENGSYAFSLELRGSTEPVSSYTFQFKNVYYISIWSGSSMRDIAEINLHVLPSTTSTTTTATYTIMLGAEFTQGENVTVKLSHYAPYLATPWTLSASATNIQWWKL
ncbi:MAG: hypothetical protein LBQ73_06650 [Tannerellaceae bacterium]|jgi:hypothetical protein|nr:hypothetical protein [Tannerellaceae bacterium]